MGNSLAGEGIAERRNVLVNHRAWVNNRDVAVTDHVGTRAIKRKPGWVARRHSANKGRYGFKRCISKLVLVNIRDCDSHKGLQLKQNDTRNPMWVLDAIPFAFCSKLSIIGPKY